MLLALGKRLSGALAATQDHKEYLLLEASLVFVKTLLSLQGFLRFIPASQFHAKEEDFVIDLSSASLMARQTLEDAISFFYLSQPSLTKEQKKFRQLAWHPVSAAQHCWLASTKSYAYSQNWNPVRFHVGHRTIQVSLFPEVSLCRST